MLSRITTGNFKHFCLLSPFGSFVITIVWGLLVEAQTAAPFPQSVFFPREIWSIFFHRSKRRHGSIIFTRFLFRFPQAVRILK